MPSESATPNVLQVRPDGQARRRHLLTSCSVRATPGPDAFQFQPAQVDIAGGGGNPPIAYYSAFASIHDGRFDRALDLFRNAARGSRRTVAGRWIDSVCYYVMMGESLYQQGQLELALQQYNDGLQVFLSQPEWMRRVQWPGAVNMAAAQRINPPTWGPSSRNPQPAGLPNSFQVLIGNPNIEQVIQQGGIVDPPEYNLLDIPEVVRCTTLALRRRRQILGPLCHYDPLSSRMVVALEGRIGPVNHWAQAWIDIQRAAALTGVDKYDEALPLYQRALQLAGRFDHPLTATALFELGNIAEMTGDVPAAQNFFLEASLSAGYYDQILLVEESLRRAIGLRLASGTAEPIPKLGAVNTWATRRRLRHLSATASRLAAEHLAAGGESKAALSAIDQARKSLGRRAEMAAQLAADLDYVAALANYSAAKPTAGAKQLRTAVAQQKACSKWQYQIGVANNLYKNDSETLTARSAVKLYADLLREPTPQDWKTNPLESLTMTLASDLDAHQNWLEAAVERRELETVVEVGESMRRRRFARYLPLGGRLLSLRWLMEADEARLNEAELALRRDLILRYPNFGQFSDVSAAARKELGGLPIAPLEEQLPEMSTNAQKLNRAAKDQEALLGMIALKREYCPTIFPPRKRLNEIQAALTDKQVMLAFTTTPRGMQAVMISRDDEATWPIPNAAALRRKVVTLLRAMGMQDDNSTLTAKQLQLNQWEVISADLTNTLIDDAQQGFWNRFDELILVPDGFLWYLPFEALIAEDRGSDGTESTFPLISRMSIRYAPTMSLAVTSRRDKPRHDRTVTLLGQMFPRDDVETAREEFEQMQTVVEGLKALPERLPVPTSLMRTVWDRLMVLDDVGDSRKGPLDWVPVKLAAAKGDNTLSRWLRSPWGAPEQVLLPGFHSAAEAGLRQQADGDDLFAAVTGLMAAGTRTVLISRWRTGGQTSYELMREFMQEAPHMPLAEAWQRSVQVVRENEIDPRREPRISHSANAEPIQASHPFFWAGYLLVDNGQPVDDSTIEDKPAEPSLNEAGI